MDNKRAYIKFIIALLLFGSNGIVASRIQLNSYEIVFTRTLIGSLLLVILFAATHRPLHFFDNRQHAIYLVISGAAMGASWMFLFEAYRQVGVSIATLIYYCGPVIVMALSPVLYQEKLTPVKTIGFLAVLAGMVCINLQALTEGNTIWGLFCGLMSAVMFALMVISNKQARSIGGLENPMWQLVFSFLAVALYVGFRQGLVITIEPGSILPILLLGLINTGLGCYLYFSSLGSLPVQSVSICGYLDPLSAVIFSVVFLGEPLGLERLLGGVLILGGAAFGELYGRRGWSFEI